MPSIRKNDDNAQNAPPPAFKRAPAGWFSRLARRALLATPSGNANFNHLCAAARSENLEEIHRLLPLVGAWGKDASGSTPLFWAAAGKPECVEALLPASEPRSSSKTGDTPLMIAAVSGNPRCVELLLPHSDPWRQDSSGYDALMQAARGHDDSGAVACIKLLLPSSNPGARDNEGRCALGVAAAKGMPSRVAALLPYRDPNAQDRRGRTPLMLAAQAGSLLCVEILLPVSDPRQEDADGWSAHEIARAAGRADIVSLIEGRERSQKERLAIDAGLPHAPTPALPVARSRL